MHIHIYTYMHIHELIKAHKSRGSVITPVDAMAPVADTSAKCMSTDPRLLQSPLCKYSKILIKENESPRKSDVTLTPCYFLNQYLQQLK